MIIEMLPCKKLSYVSEKLSYVSRKNPYEIKGEIQAKFADGEYFIAAEDAECLFDNDIVFVTDCGVKVLLPAGDNDYNYAACQNRNRYSALCHRYNLENNGGRKEIKYIDFVTMEKIVKDKNKSFFGVSVESNYSSTEGIQISIKVSQNAFSVEEMKLFKNSIDSAIDYAEMLESIYKGIKVIQENN